MKKSWLVVWLIYFVVLVLLVVTLISRKDQTSVSGAGMIVFIAISFGAYLFYRARYSKTKNDQ